MKAYKLVRMRDDGVMRSLFYDRRRVLRMNQWYKCNTIREGFNTKWNCLPEPKMVHGIRFHLGIGPNWFNTAEFNHYVTKREKLWWVEVEMKGYNKFLLSKPRPNDEWYYRADEIKIESLVKEQILDRDNIFAPFPDVYDLVEDVYGGIEA